MRKTELVSLHRKKWSMTAENAANAPQPTTPACTPAIREKI